MERPVPESDPRDERVLVLAPSGRDARLIAETLARAGLSPVIQRDLDALCTAMLEGAGAVFLAEEALTPDGVTLLSRTLHRQPVWSDLPLIVATGEGETTQ